MYDSDSDPELVESSDDEEEEDRRPTPKQRKIAGGGCFRAGPALLPNPKPAPAAEADKLVRVADSMANGLPARLQDAPPPPFAGMKSIQDFDAAFSEWDFKKAYWEYVGELSSHELMERLRSCTSLDDAYIMWEELWACLLPGATFMPPVLGPRHARDEELLTIIMGSYASMEGVAESLLERHPDRGKARFLKPVWNFLNEVVGDERMDEFLIMNCCPVALPHHLWQQDGILAVFKRLPKAAIQLNCDIISRIVSLAKGDRDVDFMPFSSSAEKLIAAFPYETTSLRLAGRWRDVKRNKMVHLCCYTKHMMKAALSAHPEWVAAGIKYFEDIAGQAAGAAFADALGESPDLNDRHVKAIVDARAYGLTIAQWKPGESGNVNTQFQPGESGNVNTQFQPGESGNPANGGSYCFTGINNEPTDFMSKSDLASILGKTPLQVLTGKGDAKRRSAKSKGPRDGDVIFAIRDSKGGKHQILFRPKKA